MLNIVLPSRHNTPPKLQSLEGWDSNPSQIAGFYWVASYGKLWDSLSSIWEMMFFFSLRD